MKQKKKKEKDDYLIPSSPIPVSHRANSSKLNPSAFRYWRDVFAQAILASGIWGGSGILAGGVITLGSALYLKQPWVESGRLTLGFAFVWLLIAVVRQIPMRDAKLRDELARIQEECADKRNLQAISDRLADYLSEGDRLMNEIGAAFHAKKDPPQEEVDEWFVTVRDSIEEHLPKGYVARFESCIVAPEIKTCLEGKHYPVWFSVAVRCYSLREFIIELTHQQRS